jgi:hypothetical protein
MSWPPCFLSFFLSFGSTELTLARQALYHLTHSSSPHVFFL